MKEIAIPKKLSPLIQAFSTECKSGVRVLIQDAARMICGSDFGANPLSDDELEGIAALMLGMHPKDTLEAIYAAQIVASHMLGMRKLSESFVDDQRLGLQLLKFSNEAMLQLEKKRGGGVQNITVTYNHNGHGPALMQTVLPKGCHADQRS